QFIHTIEQRQGFKVACLEEIAYRKGWLTKDQVLSQAKILSKTQYGQYLQMLVEEQ
ncbi:glucose-1-phosphate thymidylyltransferase, partial [Klebsiella pneumoniae]|nr:glucose-1-phosphate thymidylyltransferase [Klebsiella pneumoniae]